MSKSGFAWSWKDYERELAKERRAAAPADKSAVADSETAARARPLHGGVRCEDEAPEGSSGAAPAIRVTPANASPARPPIKQRAPAPVARSEPAVRRSGKISLADAPSGMEERAARWRSPAAAAEAERARDMREEGAGRAFCKCGGWGQEGGYVPADFGRDCIEKDCPLKGSHV